MLTRPDLLLRLEALLVLVGSLFCYPALHGSWWLFAVLFLAPDISLIGYLSGDHTRLAARIYNAAHSYVLPLVLGLAAWKVQSSVAGQVAVIWVAHIAFDRFLGFGLKYRQAFKPTHIQNVRIFRSL